MITFTQYTYSSVVNNEEIDLVPVMPLGFTYTKSDTYNEDGTVTRILSCDDSEISKLTSMRFGDDTDAQDASNIALSLLSVDLLNVSTLTNCAAMFYNCSNVVSIDTEYFITDNIIHMNSMFRNCSKLTQLDVSNWNTSNVQYMNTMFYRCSQLTHLDVSNWDY